MQTRRRFLEYFAGLGLGSTLLPEVLWGKMQDAQATEITPEMIEGALAVAGLEFTPEAVQGMVRGVNRALERYVELREIHIPDEVAPAFHFSPIVSGLKVDREARPFRASPSPDVRRPANLEDVAFWSIGELAALLKTRQVTSVELTTMYLGRLKRYNGKLNNVVTFLDDLAMEQARAADAEIAAGRYKGPLHGIPWGAKDIIGVKGYLCTWGAEAYEDQISKLDATVVERLRDAGAVLVAKLSTGELAHGDQWFRGRTNNPWDPSKGSSGSSAGPASATAGGGVAFGVGSDTAGSIMSPSAICGLSGMVPTSGRVSRYGVMTLNWTLDRIGPLCRSVEDCALVMSVIAGPDDRDLSLADIPFNYDAAMDVHALRVGYLDGLFDNEERKADWAKNDLATIARLKAMGFQVVPVELPKFPSQLISSAVEAAAFFDDLLRSGRAERISQVYRNSFRTERVEPAVEYIQTQRVRSIMMRQYAETLEDVDVYLAPSYEGDVPRRPSARRGGVGRGGREGRGATGRPTGRLTSRSRAYEHFWRANACGYPEIAVPNGFDRSGMPTSISFMAKPYGEAGMLALAKAYQDDTGFQRRHPAL